MSGHRLLSWLRQGVSVGRGAAITATVHVTVAGGGTDEIAAQLYGPGDVATVTPRMIGRREPAPKTLAASPNRFAYVELAPADLPWRFSPGAAVGGRLMPWLALVVVPATVAVAPVPGADVLMMTVAANELPDPAELWAWAHVQIEEPVGGMVGSVANFVRAHPECAVARLVAARRLAPNTNYRAALVPVFEAGRLAALGKPPATDGGLRPAWQVGAATVELPMYDSWEFTTTAAADFETIARRLRPADGAQMFSPISVDVREALSATASAPTVAKMYGLLRPVAAASQLPSATAIADGLASKVVDSAAVPPVVGLPLYGGVPAQRQTVRTPDIATDWLAELNLDPRRRLMAAAGAAVVRADQEPLVAAVRARLGQVAQANRAIRGAQLATLTVARMKKRHVAARPAERMVAMLWANATVRPTVAAPELLSLGWRRLTRPGGLLKRRGVLGLAWTRLGRDLFVTVTNPTPRGPGGVTMGSTVSAALATTTTALTVPPRVVTDAGYRQAIAEALTARAKKVRATITLPTGVVPDVKDIARKMLAEISPQHVAVRTGLRLDGIAESGSMVFENAPLAEVRPELSADGVIVLAERIATLTPERFLPGIAAMPIDQVVVLEVDSAAVEAAVVGANHELVRELSWRGVPVAPRGTLLRQVWQRSNGAIADDVATIASWSGRLGTHAVSAPAVTVMVLRSELVRRFPDAMYLLVPAVTHPTAGRKPGDISELPMFRGRCGDDIGYVGFARSVASMQQGAGCYLVIAERPGQPRFGLDDKQVPGATSWLNLSWAEVKTDPYLRLTPAPTAYPPPLQWAGSAAQMAGITERPAARIAIHIDELIA